MALKIRDSIAVKIKMKMKCTEDCTIKLTNDVKNVFNQLIKGPEYVKQLSFESCHRKVYNLVLYLPNRSGYISLETLLNQYFDRIVDYATFRIFKSVCLYPLSKTNSHAKNLKKWFDKNEYQIYVKRYHDIVCVFNEIFPAELCVMIANFAIKPPSFCASFFT